MGLVNSCKSATVKADLFKKKFFKAPFLYIKKKIHSNPLNVSLKLDWYDLDEERYDFKS